MKKFIGINLDVHLLDILNVYGKTVGKSRTQLINDLIKNRIKNKEWDLQRKYETVQEYINKKIEKFNDDDYEHDDEVQ